MTSHIVNIAVDCADAYGLARFWSEVTGRPLHPEDRPGDPEVRVLLPEGPILHFNQVPEPKTVKNRLHLCLRPETSREEETERLLALGRVFRIFAGPRRQLRHLAALSHLASTTRYERDPPPCDAPHLTPRPDPRRSKRHGLGATEVADLRNPDGTGWRVLADPEGNELCVLRGKRDLAAAEEPAPEGWPAADGPAAG